MRGKNSGGDCPKCLRHHDKLTRHHILVRKWFGHSENSPCLLICRSCHNELHKLIPENELKTIDFYWNIVFVFLNRTRIQVVEYNGKRRYYVSKYDDRPLLQMQSAVGEQVDSFLRQEVP